VARLGLGNAGLAQQLAPIGFFDPAGDGLAAVEAAIASEGTFERWKGRKKRYLYPGDGWKYWAMTTHMPSSRVLNRMRIEDDLARLRAEGQLEAVAFAERQLR
jgi:hypothetical protein